MWCVLLKLRYSVEQLKTVNSLVLLPLHKRIRQLICITAHIYSNLSSFCVRCCSASSWCCYPSQQAGSGSLPPPQQPPVTQEKPVSPSTFVITQRQPRRAIEGSRPARRNPVPTHKKRMLIVISLPHCQEFNFTQLTSARDKWNINNVTHSKVGVARWFVLHRSSSANTSLN